MLPAGSLAVTGKTDFPFRIAHDNNDYEMVMSAEGYAAVIVALAVVLCTHCNPIQFAFIAAKDEGAWGDQAKAAFLNAEGKGAWGD